jgi:hypothetical protein
LSTTFDLSIPRLSRLNKTVVRTAEFGDVSEEYSHIGEY